MLTGKKLGEAIASAIQKKIDSGAVKSKAEVARHFGIKPPSIHTWINNGTVSKDKLPELWNYFSDVVGPEHWGIPKLPNEWATTKYQKKKDWPFDISHEQYDVLENRIKDSVNKFLSIATKEYPISNDDYTDLTESINEAIKLMRTNKVKKAANY